MLTYSLNNLYFENRRLVFSNLSDDFRFVIRLLTNLDKVELLFQGSITTTGIRNFFKEITYNFKYINIVTAGAGTFRLKLDDYNSFPIYLHINGFDAANEYVQIAINKSNFEVMMIKISGSFQTEIKKIYLSNC